MTTIELWRKEYQLSDGRCALCENSGILTCRDGSGRYCICPNGRGWRKANGPLPTESDPKDEVFSTNKDIYGNERGCSRL
jgi:hypothetical protein